MEGSSSLINKRRGSSLGTKRLPSIPGVAPFPDGVVRKLVEAKNSAGLLLILVAEEDVLGRNLPPPCGVNDRGVIRATGLGGPADGGAKIR